MAFGARRGWNRLQLLFKLPLGLNTRGGKAADCRGLLFLAAKRCRPTQEESKGDRQHTFHVDLEMFRLLRTVQLQLQTQRRRYKLALVPTCGNSVIPGSANRRRLPTLNPTQGSARSFPAKKRPDHGQLGTLTPGRNRRSV